MQAAIPTVRSSGHTDFPPVFNKSVAKIITILRRHNFSEFCFHFGWFLHIDQSYQI